MKFPIGKPTLSRLKIFLAILIGTTLNTCSMNAIAAEIFSNDGIQFDVDTVIEFEFVESHGAYQSTFGVMNLATGEKMPLLSETKASDSDDPVFNKKTDFLGTPGNAVPQPLAEFKFQAHTPYTFYLESTYKGRPAGIVYSLNIKNLGGNKQVIFDGDLAKMANGGTILRWDDTGSLLVSKDQDDNDFNDFIVRLGGHQACRYDKNQRNSASSQRNSGQTQSQSFSSSCQSPV